MLGKDYFVEPNQNLLTCLDPKFVVQCNSGVAIGLKVVKLVSLLVFTLLPIILYECYNIQNPETSVVHSDWFYCLSTHNFLIRDVILAELP
jgi:hypothetical protein